MECQMIDINFMTRGKALAPKQTQLITIYCTVRSSRQRPCNQSVGCLLCSVLRIYEGMGLRTCVRFLGMVPCCGHDGVGYQAQVPQKPKET